MSSERCLNSVLVVCMHVPLCVGVYTIYTISIRKQLY